MARLIGGFDCETTGFDATTGDRFVEVALLVYDADTGFRRASFIERINPERAIPADATRVHKITFEDVAKCKPFDHFAGSVRKQLDFLDALVIHNAGFDVPFLQSELRRCGQSDRMPKIIDTMQRWATFDGKSPNLGELCLCMGVPYDPAKAHGADYDAEVMMEAYFKGAKRGFFEKLPPAEPMRSAA